MKDAAMQGLFTAGEMRPEEFLSIVGAQNLPPTTNVPGVHGWT